MISEHDFIKDKVAKHLFDRIWSKNFWDWTRLAEEVMGLIEDSKEEYYILKQEAERETTLHD